MRKFFSCAIILAAMLLTGCSRSEQVHDKNYVRAISVSESGKMFSVFAFFGDKSEPCAATGADMENVKSNAELTMGKSLFTGHTELIVLGECDYAKTLELLLNEWKVSPSCLVVYGGKDCAEALKKNDAEALADSVKHAIEQGKAPECDIVTVLGGLLSKEGEAQVAQIDKNGFDGSVKLKK